MNLNCTLSFGYKNKLLKEEFIFFYLSVCLMNRKLINHSFVNRTSR